jgi:hypothetical protein
MKSSNDTIGNRTRDLPACSVVPRTNGNNSYLQVMEDIKICFQELFGHKEYKFNNAVYLSITAFLWFCQIFLSAFAKLQKSDHYLCRVCMFVCPSVRSHRTTRLSLDGFSLNLIFQY